MLLTVLYLIIKNIFTIPWHVHKPLALNRMINTVNNLLAEPIEALSHCRIFVFLIHIVHLRAPAQSGSQIWCHPWISASNFVILPFLFPWQVERETRGNWTLWDRVFFWESLNCNIVFVCLRRSHDYQGGYCVWGDCELPLPFKHAPSLHYERSLRSL